MVLDDNMGHRNRLVPSRVWQPFRAWVVIDLAGSPQLPALLLAQSPQVWLNKQLNEFKLQREIQIS